MKNPTHAVAIAIWVSLLNVLTAIVKYAKAKIVRIPHMIAALLNLVALAPLKKKAARAAPTNPDAFKRMPKKL